MRFPTIIACLATAATLGFPSPSLAVQQDSVQADTTEKKKENKNLPLEAGRTLSVSTDEGTWISVDVSPDGQSIAFDLLGDLYTMSISGGTATQVTSGMAFDASPRFSPDGGKVLFVSDRSGGENLWTLELESGDTTQLTKGNGGSYVSPDWSPDGTYIVASKGETRLGAVKLWMGHIDGGSGKTLISEPANRKTVGGAFSPDGRYIWYARRNNSWDYNAQLPQYQLAVYDRDTGERFTRTSRYGSAFRPTVSPDGKWVVYGSRFEAETGLRIRDIATGDERWLAYPVQHDEQEGIADRDVLPGMSFTPDSREVVASYGGKIWRIPVDGGEPVAVPFQVNTELGIGPRVVFEYPISDEPTFIARQIRDAVPSPDGSRLAFTAMDRLYVMEYPDGEPQAITNLDGMSEAQPAWSPDGEWLAYVTWAEADGGHIHRIRPNGQDAQRVTTVPAIYQQLAWAPNGQRIVAIRGPARAYEESTGPFAAGAAEDLVWVAAEGGAPQVIAPAEGRGNPHFTASGDRIHLFHGANGLVSIRWDGTDQKEHVKVTGNKRPGATQPNRASLITMAPVGDQALATVNNDVYVVTVPYVGGETPTIAVSNPENAAFPARKLTDIGGQFPSWESNGRKVHWSIGNAHVVYDLDAAKAFEDSVKAAASDTAEAADSADGADEEKEKKPKYEPQEHRIEIAVPRDIPQGTMVLRGARVVTMRGTEVMENADVVVTNNRISSVGPRGSAPGDAQVVDVSGMTIVPGFVDAHSHMWPSWGIHKTQVWLYLANLAYGVTTTRDPQTSSTDVLTYGDKVDAGMLLGPRVYSTGPGVFGDYAEDPIRDLDHARDVLKRYSEYYDTKTIKMYMAGNRQQRQWVIMAAKEQGLMPTTEGGLRFMYELSMMIDGYPGQEHSFPVFPVYKDVVQLTAESQITYTPTLLVSYGGPFGENYYFSRENPHNDEKLARFTPHHELDALTRRRGAGWFLEDEHVFPKHAAQLKKIVEAGGRVGVGSHGQLQGLGYHWEMWSIGSGGMSNHDVLRVATILGAEAIGLGKDVGSIESGKLADMVILAGNPLEDLRNTNTIRYVMKNGRLYDGDTLNEVWPTERPLALPKYWKDVPNTAAGVGR